jgi:CRP-like cAMP-binding protein
VPNPWIMKMEQFTRFSETEKRRLDQILSERHARHAPGEDIFTEGDHMTDCHVVLTGLACRYKMLPDGERQIMAFLLPGDLCDAEIFILKEMDHSVGALTPTTTALISGDTMRQLLREPGRMAEALWWGTLTDLGVLRERIVDHGRRDARERIAHLLYEMLIRYRIVDLTSDDEFKFPITQTDLADATGMTSVHVNRVLQGLRANKLIDWRGDVVTVLDPPGLKELAGFNANYLHLDRVHDTDDRVGDRAGDLV